MPHDQPPSSDTRPAPAARSSFRARYDDLEKRRTALVARLKALGGRASRHPGYKRALKLLNETFRGAKLAQRLAILQAASWLIDILEQITSIT
jgi:hypothetical protein